MQGTRAYLSTVKQSGKNPTYGAWASRPWGEHASRGGSAPGSKRARGDAQAILHSAATSDVRGARSRSSCPSPGFTTQALRRDERLTRMADADARVNTASLFGPNSRSLADAGRRATAWKVSMCARRKSPYQQVQPAAAMVTTRGRRGWPKCQGCYWRKTRLRERGTTRGNVTQNSADEGDWHAGSVALGRGAGPSRRIFQPIMARFPAVNL